jgi:hypothetical protein
MNTKEKLKTLAGILLIVTALTHLLQMIFEPVLIFVQYEFSYTISADNVIEYVTEQIVAGIGAAITAFILYLFALMLGAAFCALYLLLGIFMFISRRGKYFFIFCSIIMGFAIILGIRALYLLTLANYVSYLTIFHLIVDILVLSLSIYMLIKFVVIEEKSVEAVYLKKEESMLKKVE